MRDFFEYKNGNFIVSVSEPTFVFKTLEEAETAAAEEKMDDEVSGLYYTNYWVYIDEPE